MKFGQLINGVWRQNTVPGTVDPYEEMYSVVSDITAGTNVTLPSSRNYQGDELFVFLNGQMISAGSEYNYVGTGTRTQVVFTVDLLAGDVVLFRVA